MKSNAENILINTDKRLFYLSDDIDSTSIGKMCFNLLCLLQQDDEDENEKRDFKREPIHIYINSVGGNIYDMWALIDIIEHSQTPIYTYCTGYAMSAALSIFLAGHKRFATRHATFMYHQIYSYAEGKYQDLVEDIRETDYLNKQNEEYVIKKTKLTKSDIDNIRNRKQDFFIHTDDALKLGIIHEII